MMKCDKHYITCKFYLLIYYISKIIEDAETYYSIK